MTVNASPHNPLPVAAMLYMTIVLKFQAILLVKIVIFVVVLCVFVLERMLLLGVHQ